eukprot:4737298-Pyramimonas_sp.AAC.1
MCNLEIPNSHSARSITNIPPNIRRILCLVSIQTCRRWRTHAIPSFPCHPSFPAVRRLISPKCDSSAVWPTAPPTRMPRTTTNTESAPSLAAAVRPLVRPSAEWPPERWRRKSSRRWQG